MSAPPPGVYLPQAWGGLPGARWRRRRFGRDVLEVRADVVVVGSGAGGGVVAAELAEAGVDVVVVEEGGWAGTEDFGPDAGRALRGLYRDAGMRMALGVPPVLFSEGRCVGGSTVINGGMTWRTPERILDGWALDDGVEHIRAKDMERWFERVERRVSAGRQADWSIGRDNQLLAEGAAKLGWHTVKNIRNQLHCAGSNNCAFGCPTGAKRSVILSYLPRALAFGARVLAGARVDRVLFDGRRATGVEGPGFRVRANRTVVCGGAVQTPALLQTSGVRSRSGNLGRRLSLHPNIKLVALMREPVRGWQGVHQAFQVEEHGDSEGLRLAAVNVPPSLTAMTLPMYGSELARVMGRYDHMVVAGMLMEDSVYGRVRAVGGTPVTTYQVTDDDGRRLVRGASLLAELLFEVGAEEIILPFEGVPSLKSVDDARALTDQTVALSKMELVTVHIMGTAAMGSDPTRHVCDSYGGVYDADSLFVADASLFPGPIGINPMETIMALATRVASRLIESS